MNTKYQYHIIYLDVSSKEISYYLEYGKEEFDSINRWYITRNILNLPEEFELHLKDCYHYPNQSYNNDLTYFLLVLEAYNKKILKN